MLKIGEFARLNGISIATLHYYDRCGLLKPLSIDPETGYRYYSLDQLPRLNRILALKDLGFPLDQVAQLLAEGLSFEQLLAMFTLKQAQTQHMIAAEQARLMRLAARLHQIEQEGKMPNYEILLKNIDPQLVASYRSIVPLPHGFAQSHTRVATYLIQHHMASDSPALFRLYSTTQQRPDGLYIDLEASLPLPSSLPGNDHITIQTLPGGLVASAIHTGYDLALGSVHSALHAWLKDNQYRLIAPPRHIRLRHDPHIPPSQYITELQFPIAAQQVKDTLPLPI
jgi:DNA-binding transcriptional MerR regulator